jgi:hypothetical protein
MTEAIDAQAAFTGTVTPEGADKLDEAKLTAWFEANVAGFQGPLHRLEVQGRPVEPHLQDRRALRPLRPAPQAARQAAPQRPRG